MNTIIYVLTGAILILELWSILFRLHKRNEKLERYVKHILFHIKQNPHDLELEYYFADYEKEAKLRKKILLEINQRFHYEKESKNEQKV